MKIYINILFLFASLCSFGQITITGSDLPQAGTTYLVQNDTVPVIALGTASASWQQWDFSAMNNHYYKVADYDATSSTPYAADFPTSNVDTYGPSIMYSSLYGGAPVDEGSNGYMFWRSDNTGFWAVGFRADAGPYSNNNVNYNPEELLIGTPATYGTVFNDTSRWELSMNLNAADIDTFYVVDRVKTLTVDAWGEIITPYGTFTDVIRIHEYATELDSVRSVLGMWDSTFYYTSDTVNIYKYMANNVGYPIAIVHADKNNIVQDVEYLIDTTYYLGMEGASTEAVLTLYPNPSSNLITIEVPNPENTPTLYIYDMFGKEIRRIFIRNTRTNLNVKEFSTGIYFYQLIENEEIKSSGKFIKN